MKRSRKEGVRHPKVMTQRCFDEIVETFVRFNDPGRIRAVASEWADTVWAEDKSLAADEAIERLERRNQPFTLEDTDEHSLRKSA